LKKYNLALISPKGSFYHKNALNRDILKDLVGIKNYSIYWSGLSSGLPIIASQTDDDFSIEIIDENIEEIDYNKNYDLVGITAMTHQAIRAYQISSEFRKKGIHTVIGGIHPTFMYDESKKYADTVVIGEAENIWSELLNDFKKNKIKKIYHQKDYPPVNLKNQNIPRYDLLKNKNYNIIWLNSQRGCPYDCEFCSVNNIFGNNIRYKNPDQILKEIEYIKNIFKRIYIGFSDDNFFINKKKSKELLIKLKNLNIRWVGQSDISIGEDLKLLNLASMSGCHALFIGFESLNEMNLKNIYEKGKMLKKEYLKKYEELSYNIQSYGIGIIAAFIVGLDNDTNEVFDNIYNFIDRTNIPGIQIHILTPLPGTRLRTKLLKENRVLPTSWDNYTFWDINYIPKNMNYYQLENGVLNTYKKIYSEDRIIKVTEFFKNILKKNINRLL